MPKPPDLEEQAPEGASPERCPFCGETIELRAYQVGGSGRQSIYCDNCRARGPTADDIAGAWEEWNQRLGC